MYTLLELDEYYNRIQIYDVTDNSDPSYLEEHKAISFNTTLLDDFLKEWQLHKQELAGGKINREEY